MHRALLCAAVASAAISPAFAGEETLAFKFATKAMEGTSFDAPAVEGQAVSANTFVGFATFEDGRTAIKEFVGTSMSAGETGAFNGFSTYRFGGGDTISLSYVGGWGADGAGGDYTVVSGTGAYDGATGSGRFDALESPYEGWDYWEARIVVTTPGS